MNNDEKQVHVITEDYNSVPYKNLALALKVNFQCILIFDFKAIESYKDITHDNLLFVNKGDTEPVSELRLNGWSAEWKIRDDGVFFWYKSRLDWKYYAPNGECRSRDISRYTGWDNIYAAIKELGLLSSFTDWKNFDLHVENKNLKSKVEKLETKVAELDDKLNAIKQLLS